MEAQADSKVLIFTLYRNAIYERNMKIDLLLSFSIWEAVPLVFEVWFRPLFTIYVQMNHLDKLDVD